MARRVMRPQRRDIRLPTRVADGLLNSRQAVAPSRDLKGRTT